MKPMSYVNDPSVWSSTAPEDESDKETWITSYLDVLTLLLTLLVLIIAYQMHEAKNSPATNELPGEATKSVAKVETTPSSLTVVSAVAKPSSNDKAANKSAMAHTLSTKTETLKPQLDPEAEFVTSQILKPLLDRSVPAMFVRQQTASEPTFVKQIGDESSTLMATTLDQPTQGADAFIGTLVDTSVAGSPRQSESSKITALKQALRTALGDNVPTLEMLPDGLAFALPEQILFAPGSAAVSPQGVEILKTIAPALVDFTAEVFVEGHTDNVPIATALFPSNWELSTHRATSVTRHLITIGFPPARLRAIGFGDTKPVSDNETPVGRATNRRVSLIIHMTDDDTGTLTTGALLD